MLKNKKKSLDGYLMKEFFLNVWNIKPHNCEICGKWLGKEPLSYMFDHILTKSKYPAIKFEIDNIMMMCLHCHDEKTRGFHSEKTINKIKYLKEKFNIT
jgi:hypothetical protein